MGNLTSHGGWTLNYSPSGQLLSAVKSGIHTQSYGYDAFGNRAYEASDWHYPRKLLYVGRQLLDSYELPSGGGTAIVKSYIFGPGIDRPIAEITGNAATTIYPLQDANGNVVALVNISGAVIERYTYDAWGTPKAYNASWTPITTAPQSRFLFTGRDYDPETGLYHYRSRAYLPALGRFLQPDTIDFYGRDLNIYAYVFNSPSNFKDPLGLDGTLTMATDGRGSALPGVQTGNHSWLEYTPDGGTTTSYGTYGNDSGNQGVKGVNTSDGDNTGGGKRSYDPTAERSTHLDSEQEKAFMDYINSQSKLGPSAWSPNNNCSVFAANGWKAATGEPVDPAKGGNINSPKNLETSIKDLNKYMPK